MKRWSIMTFVVVLLASHASAQGTGYNFDPGSVLLTTESLCLTDHCCKRGPHILQVLPQGACKVAATTVPGLLRDGGDRYYREVNPPCDPSLRYERQAWSDWPECEGARQLK